MTGRQEAMRRLSQYIRFGRMKGEFLVKHVLTLPEMSSPECQERVKQGIYFLAYSDAEQIQMTDSVFQERKGIRDPPSLEMECGLTMRESGESVKSRAISWLGMRWRILDCEAQELERSVHFTLFVKKWPEGIWQQIKTALTHKFLASAPNFGYADGLGTMLWEDARKSDKNTSSTGQINLKVLVSRS